MTGILKTLEKELETMVESARQRKVPALSIMERDDESAYRIFRETRKFITNKVNAGAGDTKEIVEEAKNHAE